MHKVAAYRLSTPIPPSAVLCYVAFQAPLLCAGILGSLRLPKFPNNSESTWQSIRRSTVCMQTICNCNTDNPTDISLYACVQTHKTHRAGQFTCSLEWSYSPSPSPLSQACIDDNVDMVTFLVEHGAGINQPDNEGWIPLHAAASCGYLDIAE